MFTSIKLRSKSSLFSPRQSTLPLALLAALAVSNFCCAEEMNNLAASTRAFSSSVFQDNYQPDKAVDGIVSDESRWVSHKYKGPHWLELHFGAAFEFGSAHVYSGWKQGSAIRNFSLQYLKGGKWIDIPGGRVKNNPDSKTAIRVTFDKPVISTKIRFVSPDDGHVRLKELLLFRPTKQGTPPLGTGLKVKPGRTGPDTTKHHVLANQSGFNASWSKRFTAPLSEDGTPFSVVGVDSNRTLLEGKIENHIGDFSELPSSDEELIIRVAGGNLSSGQSFPFAIQPLHTQSIALEPALRFMVDCRSIVGTHPSAYGGRPWRDGTYYTYETPSLILLYLSHPSFFDSLPVEIDYRSERKRVLSPKFKIVRQVKDYDTMEAVRNYYTKLDPPVGNNVPDIIQLIHFGIGWQLVDPDSEDPSGDKRGEKVHAQTIEQFAYFLYAYPHFKQYFTESFYNQVYEYTFDQWQEVGLLKLLTEIGELKGRESPGHSIAPNLMMYEVATRHGRSDAERYLNAAVKQAQWYVDKLDPSDPRITRGQRLSEHPPITGLFMLYHMYPERAPSGISAWFQRWFEVVQQRSDNMYDFRKFNDELWTLPKPWSDPGSVAGFPGIAVMVKTILPDQNQQERLDELKASHYDTLFGRNPVNAASANKGAEAYPGLDRGWPYKYGDDICARLELCRGTLNTIAAHEHYPFKPQARFRHPEGWSGFNAAFNVSLAYCCWDDCRIELQTETERVSADQPMSIAVKAARAFKTNTPDALSVDLSVDGTASGKITLEEFDTDESIYRGRVSLDQLGVEPGQDVTISYGYGLFRKQVELRFDEAHGSWRAN